MNRPRMALALAAALLGTSAGGLADEPPKLKVCVSILPQAYFVERIGGSQVSVEVLVGPGQSPHAYEPTPRQLASIGECRAYFTVGIDFESVLVPRLEQMFPNLRFVDTRRGVPLRYFVAQEAEAEEHEHEHGHAGGQGHAGESHEHGPSTAPGHATSAPGQTAGRPDPHIWLNPLYVKTQAQTICDAMCELSPAQAAEFRKNLTEFQADLDRVNRQIAEALAPLRGQAIFVFHPAFGYFTDAYGLRQAPVEIEGKEPTAKQLATLIARAKADRVKVIFVQPQFSRKAAQAVAEAVGGAVVPMDDLSRDYLKNLEQMAEQIHGALAGKEASPKSGDASKP